MKFAKGLNLHATGKRRQAVGDEIEPLWHEAHDHKEHGFYQ